jgi:hypothetical protein
MALLLGRSVSNQASGASGGDPEMVKWYKKPAIIPVSS